MAWKRVVVLMGVALGLVATDAAAATVTVRRVGPFRNGWLRVAVSYKAEGQPSFRLTPTCPSSTQTEWVVASSVSVVPAHREAFLDVRDDLAWLVDRRLPCTATGLTVQMLQDNRVVASAPVPVRLPAPRAVAAIPLSPPPVPSAAPRLGFAGGKYAAPQTRMSQAGVTWSLSHRLTLLLSYERTAFAPTMSKDHDDGVLTGLKLGF